MSNKTETNLLKLFDFSSTNIHYFEALNATFWDSDNTILKKNKSLKNNIENLNDDNKKIIEEAKKTLLNFKLKPDYLRYLMIEYTLSQPNNMAQLTDNYYSIIFPYYLFLLRNEGNEELYYLILDYINFSINIYERINLKNSFQVDDIEDISIQYHKIDLQIYNTKETIQIFPYINQQIELIYGLIVNMVAIQNKRNNWKKELSKVNEINQNIKSFNLNNNNILMNNIFDINKFKILPNDSFVPKGIIISIYISFEYNKNVQDRFLLLGRRYIYLFKNETLKELNTIIPLATGFTIIDLEEMNQKIRIKSGLKDLIFYIYQKDIYNEFRDKLIDILEGNKEDIFDKDDLLKCSKAFYEDKVLGGSLENTPIYEKTQKDVETLQNKLNELNNIKEKMEKECIMNEVIKKNIEELD